MSGTVHLSRQTIASNAHNNNMESVLGAGLETWAHQFLHVRRVYPKATFGHVRFSGIQCYVNRHPDVVQYIRETVQLAVPAILQGCVDQVSLIVTCYESREGFPETVEECRNMEECQIRFGDIPKDSMTEAELEQCFRDMILRLGSLEGLSSTYLNETGVSFRLELGMSSAESMPQVLHAALCEGRCMESSSDWGMTGNSSRGIVVRPLCQSNLSFGKVNLFHRRIKQVHGKGDRQPSFNKNTLV